MPGLAPDGWPETARSGSKHAPRWADERLGVQALIRRPRLLAKAAGMGTRHNPMQASLSPKLADEASEKPANRAGIPYCVACKSLISSEEQHHAHSGWLQRKKSKFHLKSNRFVVVTDGHVLYYSNSGDVGRSLPKAVLHLSQGSVTDSEVGDTPQTFHISGIGQKSLKLEASSESEKRQWLTVLAAQLLAKPEAGLSSIQAQAHSKLCSECGELVNLDSFTLGSHVGWLTKQGGDIKTWKRRWVVLSNNHLCYYHTPDDVAVFKPIRMVHVVKAARVEHATKPFMFTVDAGPSFHVVYFMCNTDLEHKEWIEALHIQ